MFGRVTIPMVERQGLRGPLETGGKWPYVHDLWLP